jgi:hypothetical protein
LAGTNSELIEQLVATERVSVEHFDPAAGRNAATGEAHTSTSDDNEILDLKGAAHLVGDVDESKRSGGHSPLSLYDGALRVSRSFVAVDNGLANERRNLPESR